MPKVEASVSMIDAASTASGAVGSLATATQPFRKLLSLMLSVAAACTAIVATGAPTDTRAKSAPPVTGAKTDDAEPLLDVAFENASANPFTALSDADLTRAVGRIDSFRPEERRALFTEVRRRMADRRGRIQVQQGFGRLVRRPDGTVVHLEVRKYRGEGRGERKFGSVMSGGERRPTDSDQPAPIVRVEDDAP